MLIEFIVLFLMVPIVLLNNSRNITEYLEYLVDKGTASSKKHGQSDLSFRMDCISDHLNGVKRIGDLSSYSNFEDLILLRLGKTNEVIEKHSFEDLILLLRMEKSNEVSETQSKDEKPWRYYHLTIAIELNIAAMATKSPEKGYLRIFEEYRDSFKQSFAEGKSKAEALLDFIEEQFRKVPNETIVYVRNTFTTNPSLISRIEEHIKLTEIIILGIIAIVGAVGAFLGKSL